jgi:serine phosphatase RsbU (regulator of sigma subunit)
VTVVYGEGERAEDGSLHLRFAAAGHPAPVVVRSDGTAAAVGEPGDLLGIFEEPQTRVTSVRLAAGDALVCFTDGVTERRDGSRMLGEDGVLRVLTGSAGLSAIALARRLESAVSGFTGEPARDDVAILVLRATPPADLPRPPRPAG